MLMYDKGAMEEVSGHNTCNFFMTSVVNTLKAKKIQYGNVDLNGNNPNATLEEILAKELGLKYSGTLTFSLLLSCFSLLACCLQVLSQSNVVAHIA